MHAALRPYLTAGVALVGASVVAVAPISPTPPDIKVESPAIQLAASPFAPYEAVFNTTRVNFEAILGSIDDPVVLPPGVSLEAIFEGLGDVETNFAAFRAGLEQFADILPLYLDSVQTQISGALEAAAAQAENGNFGGAFVTLLPVSLSLISLPLLPVSLGLPLLGQPGATIAALVLQKGEFAALGPALGGVAASATAFQNVLNALDDDPEDIANAFIGGPALVANAVLNGSVLPPGFPLPGIFTPGSLLGASYPGPLAFTVALGKVLGALATPPEVETFSLNSVQGGNEQFRTSGAQPRGALPGGGETLVVEKKPEVKGSDDKGNILDATKVNNAGVVENDGKTNRPRLFGGTSGSQVGGGQGLKNVREGIESSFQKTLDGLDKTIKRFTGQGNDDGGDNAAAADPE